MGHRLTPQTYLRLPQPVTLDLRIPTGPRPRVVPESPVPLPDDPEHVPELHEFSEFPLHVHFDALARTISAYLPPIPGRLELYGPEDFTAAAGDAPDDHAARVLQLLGTDLATVLQALCDGGELPPRPPRIPREIANWRARAVLELAGLLPTVEAAISAMEGPAGVVVRNAWQSAAPLARRGPTVSALAPALGLTEEQVDAMFVQAETLAV